MQTMRAAHSITSRTWLIVVALLMATAILRPLSAQQLRGTVRDSASRSPIPGAVLVFLDSSGKALGRNITNDRGEYTVVLDAAMRRMQVLRLGFRPRTLAIPQTVDGIARLDIAMVTIPRLLESVTILDQPNCPRRDDRAPAFALWEQARTALLAVVVARETNAPHVVRLLAVQRRDANDRLTSQTVLLDSATTMRPFNAVRNAAQFVERGFLYDSAGARGYGGPDAETMLDDAFASGYCFQLAAADSARPRHAGISFEPATRRRGRVDITGTLWIDTARRALSDIEFNYLSPGIMERHKAGGRISFLTLSNGSPVIDRWSLRSADFVRNPATQMTARAILNAPIEIRETIGELALVRWGDSTEWRGPLGTLRGRLADAPRAGVQVRLLDTDYRAVTDSTGRFEIPRVFPGTYRIGIIDPLFAEIDLMLMTYNRVAAARDSVSELSIVAPTARDYVAGACEASKTVADGVLVLRVESPNGLPAEGASVDVRKFVEGNAQRVAQGKTDRNGLYHLCNAPLGVPLTLRVEGRDAQQTFLTTEVIDAIKPVKIRLKSKE